MLSILTLIRGALEQQAGASSEHDVGSEAGGSSVAAGEVTGVERRDSLERPASRQSGPLSPFWAQKAVEAAEAAAAEAEEEEAEEVEADVGVVVDLVEVVVEG